MNEASKKYWERRRAARTWKEFGKAELMYLEDVGLRPPPAGGPRTLDKPADMAIWQREATAHRRASGDTTIDSKLGMAPR